MPDRVGACKPRSMPHNRRDQNAIDRVMLFRACGSMGVVAAACTMGVLFLVLWRARWTAGAPTTVGRPVLVWGVDEVFRAVRRRSESSRVPASAARAP